jgi:threonine/homoserine/homoserine lactone efflux protein
MLQKIQSFFKSTLSDLSDPSIFTFVMSIPVIIITPIMNFISRDLILICFAIIFFLWGLMGFFFIKRKEAFTFRSGKRYIEKIAILSGWVRMLFFWALSLSCLIEFLNKTLSL